MGGRPTTQWVYLVPFGRYTWELACMALAERYVTREANKKNSRKSNFLPGGLAHGPEIFRVDAAFVAAHFPSRIVWGPNPTNGVISPKLNGAETTPTSKSK